MPARAPSKTIDGRTLLYQAIREEAWLEQVLAWAKRSGWRTYHVRDSRRSSAGWPDVVLVKGPRLLFFELKTMRGRVTAEQQAWLEALGGVPGIEVGVFRPNQEREVRATLGIAA